MAEQMLPGGIRISLDDEGSGPSIVFLHGVLMSRQFFKLQLPYFSRDYRVLALDYRGHGNSDKVLGGHTVASYARDLKELLAARRVERPVLVGWSMGAMVIFEYLQLYEQDGVPGIVIMDQPPTDFAWDGYEYPVFTLDSLVRTVNGLQTDQAAQASAFVELMLHRPSESAAKWMAVEIMKVPPAIATAILVTQTFQDYREFLPKIRVPTLLAFGGDDKFISPLAGEFMASRIPRSRLLIFEHSSHCPFFEEPKRFNQALREFVQSVIV